jgi:hypothetical protein
VQVGARKVMTQAEVNQSNPADVRVPEIASYATTADEGRSRRTRKATLRGDQSPPYKTGEYRCHSVLVIICQPFDHPITLLKEILYADDYDQRQDPDFL